MLFSIPSGEDFFHVGVAVTSLYAGYQSWRANRKATEAEKQAVDSKVATEQTRVEIHETKVAAQDTKLAVSGDGNGMAGLRHMLEAHISSNDSRMLSYRGLLDECIIRLARVEEWVKQNEISFREFAHRHGVIEGLIRKLEHSSDRHSKQIDMLLSVALYLKHIDEARAKEIEQVKGELTQ